MKSRFSASLGFGFALVLVIVGLGTFATNQPLSPYSRGGWIDGLLMAVFSEKWGRIAKSTFFLVCAYVAWYFSWREWKQAGKKSNDSSKTSASEIA
jgi:hypothetical protein